VLYTSENATIFPWKMLAKKENCVKIVCVQILVQDIVSKVAHRLFYFAYQCKIRFGLLSIGFT